MQPIISFTDRQIAETENTLAGLNRWKKQEKSLTVQYFKAKII